MKARHSGAAMGRSSAQKITSRFNLTFLLAIGIIKKSEETVKDVGKLKQFYIKKYLKKDRKRVDIF